MNNELQLTKKPHELNYSAVYDMVRSMIKEAYAYEGRAPRGEMEDITKELDFQTSVLMDDLNSYFRSLTLEDVKISMKNGVRGIYGDNMGLNNKTYMRWLSAHHEEKKRASRISGPSKELMKGSPMPTDEEKRKIADDNVQHVRDTYTRTGEIVDFGNSAYTHLWNQGKIRFDESKWIHYLKEAEHIEHTRLTSERERAKSPSEFRRIGAELDNLMNMQEPESIKSMARKLALKEYFDALLISQL